MHPIFEAIKSDNYLQFKELMDNDHNLVNERDIITTVKDEGYWDKYFGQTPVHVAAKVGNLKFLKELINIYKADYNTFDESSISEYYYPIHSAAIGGQLDVIKFFLQELGVDKNCKTYERTILDLSIQCNHRECIEYLLDIGVNFLQNNLYTYSKNIYFVNKFVTIHPTGKELILDAVKNDPYIVYTFRKQFGLEITTELKLKAIILLIRLNAKDKFLNFLQEFDNLSTDPQTVNELILFTMKNEDYSFYLFEVCNYFNLDFNAILQQNNCNRNDINDNNSIKSSSSSYLTNNKHYYNRNNSNDKQDIIDRKVIYIPDIGFNIIAKDLLDFIANDYPSEVKNNQVIVFIHQQKRFATITFRKIEYVSHLLQKYKDGIIMKGMKLKLKPSKFRSFRKSKV
ncbi:hypothetical protein ABK040_014182 [Willaertia magna]